MAKRLLFLGLVVGFLACLWTAGVAAEASEDGADNSGSLHLEPAVLLGTGTDPVVAANDGFLVVWKTGGTILAREVGTKAERTASSPSVVERFSRSASEDLHVTAAGSDFVAVWHDSYRNEFQFFGPPGEIFARRMRGAAPLADPIAVSLRDRQSESVVGVEGTDAGHFVVAWNSTDTYSYYATTDQRIRAFSPMDQPSSSLSFNSRLSSLAPADDGFAVVESVLYQGVFAQKLALDGEDVGEQVPLEDGTRLAHAPGEGFLVVWKDFSGAPNLGQRLTSDFAADGDAFEISEATGQGPALVFEAIDGGFLLAWRGSVDGDSAVRWRYRRPDGVLEPPFSLFTGANFSNPESEVAVDRDGRFVGAWRSAAGAVTTRGGLIDRTVVVDDFGTDQAALTLNPLLPDLTRQSVASGIDMAGGERDLTLALTGGAGEVSVEIVDGSLVLNQGGTVTSQATLVWDQADGDASTVDGDGLRALDLTAGGTRDALAVEVASADPGARLVFDVVSASGTSSYTLELPAGSDGETFVLPFEDFSVGGDETAAGALRLVVDHQAAPGADVTVDRIATAGRAIARQTAVDVDGGELGPGDVVEYVVTVENLSDALGASATGVTFFETLADGVELVCAGVDAPEVSQGAVTGCVGPSRGIDGGGRIDADFGDLNDGSSATLTFRVVLNDSAPARVCNGGYLGSSTLVRVLSDDPATASPLDVTCLDAQAPAELSLDQAATLLVDVDSSGSITPGDRIRVTSTVTAAAGERDAVDVVFSSTSIDTALVPDSVTTTQGAVVAGNDGGDTVTVEFGTLSAASQAVVTFDVDLGVLGFDAEIYQFRSTVAGESGWDTDVLPVFWEVEEDRELFYPLFETLIQDTLIVDIDGDGQASPGDTLRYDVSVVNRSGRMGLETRFETEPLVFLSPVPGSTVTDQGSIGIGSGDRIVANIGELNGLGGGATLRFDAVIDDPLPVDLFEVSVRGSTISRSIQSQPSDDPDTPPADDPTVTPVVQRLFADGFESGDTGAWSALVELP
ncbi:MAG: hypothetical protein AAGM22_01725 [Acidobacteriota bacterium]